MSYKFDSSRVELVYSTAYHKVKNTNLMTTSTDSSKRRVTTTKPTKMVEFYMWNRRFVKPISWASDLSKVGIHFNIIEI